MDTRQLANALVLLPPGDLSEALDAATEEDRIAVERLVRRARMIGEVECTGSPVQALARQMRAERDGKA